MFRRSMSALLTLLLLLQGVAFAHCQGGACLHGPTGHDDAPHFHLCMLGLHHHEVGHHHPSHDDDPAGHQRESDRPQCPTDDDDAVYVAATLVLDGRGGPFLGGSEALGTLVCDDALVSLSPVVPPPLIRTHPAVPPPWPGCPTYLRTLALLI